VRFVGIFTVLCLVFVACQSSEQSARSEKADIKALAGLMENVFETAPENTETIIRDKRVRVVSQALEGMWFYTQLNTGEEGKLYRQRLSQLTLSEHEDAIVQIAYRLKDPTKYADAWKTPGLLNVITNDDFEPYFTEGCEQVWKPQGDGGWKGYVDPKTCVVTSKRRNKDIRIESEGYLSNDVYRTNERGYEMDMTFLWGTKPGEYIDLYPVK